MHRKTTMRPKAAYAIVIAMLIMVVFSLYSAMLVKPASAYDFRIFYAAARALQHGGNPYDIHQVFQQEQYLYPTLLKNRWQWQFIQHNPYVQGPLLLVAFLPTLSWSPATIYPVSFALLIAVTAASLFLLARLWPIRRSPLWTLFLMLSPIAFVGPFLGQIDAVLLLTLVLALRWMQRGCATYAGAILMVGLIKPQIMAGPILLLAVLAWRRGKLASYGVGLVAGVVGIGAAVALVARPTLLVAWFSSMTQFTQGNMYAQHDLSSLSTLYLGWMPHSLDAVLSAATLLAWGGACAWFWARVRTPADERWWFNIGLVGWLLVTPYAHPHDDILLFPAMWIVVDHLPASRVGRMLTAVLFLSWCSLPLATILMGFKVEILASRGLGVVPIVCLALVLLISARRPLTPDTGRVRAIADAHRHAVWG